MSKTIAGFCFRSLDEYAQYVKSVALVYAFFNDYEKTALWFSTPNPLLGGIIPMTLSVGKQKNF